LEQVVICQICKHTAVTLARHLKAVHGITADVYRGQYPGARIRSEACEANMSRAAEKGHTQKPKGLKKSIKCPNCGASHEVGYTFAPSVHDSRCPECQTAAAKAAAKAEEDIRWEGKTEGDDFVVCTGCGHRAENLTSHIQSVHPEWVGHYSGQIVALNSTIRDKTALRGRTLSDEVKAKMAASAGWNRGLTKETDPRVANAAEAMKGRVAWSKGLTKEEHPSLRRNRRPLTISTCAHPYTGAYCLV
jgi:hypothetical protein